MRLRAVDGTSSAEAGAAGTESQRGTPHHVGLGTFETSTLLADPVVPCSPRSGTPHRPMKQYSAKQSRTQNCCAVGRTEDYNRLHVSRPCAPPPPKPGKLGALQKSGAPDGVLRFSVCQQHVWPSAASAGRFVLFGEKAVLRIDVTSHLKQYAGQRRSRWGNQGATKP